MWSAVHLFSASPSENAKKVAKALKRLISDAKGTGWKGVMVALPYFVKAKTQMKLHPNEFAGLIL